MTPKIHNQHYLHFFILLVISLAIYAITSYPHAHFGFDFKFHYVMYDAFKEQISQGDIYPRWLSNVNSGFGGMNFFFYPPLFYYMQYLLDILTFENFEIETLMGISNFVILFFSGLSFYFVGCRISTPRNAFIASIAYILCFYHLWFEIFLRSAMTTIFAGIWFPLVFYNAGNAHKNNKHFFAYVFFLALQILSNLPAAVIICGFIAVHELYILYREENTKDRFAIVLKFTAGSLLGAGIACFYLFPSISLLDFFNKEFFWENDFHYQKWFLTPNIDLKANIPYVRRLLFYIGVWQLCVIATTALLGHKYLEPDEKKYGLFLCFLAAFFFFMTTPVSSPVWHYISALDSLQLPYRFSILVDFLFVLSLLFFYSSKYGKTDLAKDMLKLFVFSYILISILFFTALKDNGDSKDFTLGVIKKNHYTSQEYILPNDTLKISSMSFSRVDPPTFFIDRGETQSRIISDTSREKDIYIQADDPTTIQIRQFYFPGWSVVDTKSGKDLSMEYNLRDMEPYGHIAFDVPEGEHYLSLVLKTLPQEKTGYAITLISLALLLVYGCVAHYSRKPCPLGTET